MAIARVNIPTPTAPVGIADYQAQLDQITALNQAFTGRSLVDGSTIHAGTVMMVGGVLYKATTDTTITGTPSLYVKITPAGASASAAFVANLTGVSWNHAYGGYYDGSGNLYLFDESIAVRSGVVASAKTLIGNEGYSWDQALDSEITTRADADTALQTSITNAKTLNASGSYAMLKQISGTPKGAGETISGSSLRYSDAVGNDTSSPTGTWMCMGNSPATGSVTLWVKV